jgi:hypothetical protein
MTVSTFTVPPKDLEDGRKHRRDLAAGQEALFNGRSNNVLDVTVTDSAGSTTVTDARIGVNTVAICIPTSVNAEAAAINPYRDISAPVNGSMSLIHTNDANSKTYKVILVG